MNQQKVTFYQTLMTAAENPGLVAEYERLTGEKLVLKGIEGMIDQATGYQNQKLEKFIKLVYEFIWQCLPNEIKTV